MASQMSPSVRRKALRTFRQRGVIVHEGALGHLFSAYERLPDLDFSDFLDSIFTLLAKEDASTSGILTLSAAKKIAHCLQRDVHREQGMVTAMLEVIDTFTIPCWQPHVLNARSFSGKRVNAPLKPVIDAMPLSKAEMFRMRYELVKGKTLRNSKFRPPTSGMFSLGGKSPYYQLTGVESLAGRREEKFVLGMLTQLEEGSWFLEDLNGTIRLDLSQAHTTAGLHTECSFVIAQGYLIEVEGEEPVFRVHFMGTPPSELRGDSFNALSRASNLFGGSFEYAESATLLKMEKEAVDSVFLLMSDVALDNSKVFAGLRRVFQGYLEDGVPPKMVVLMGNFLSHPFGQQVDDVATLADGFTELGKMIVAEFPQMTGECMFVIVPGTNDPGPGNVLPRPPMPKYVMKGFIDVIGQERVYLGTNPCRIRYMTQEIVLLRDDLMQKMVRHCAVKPDFAESGKMSEHFVKSIVDQSYLCPLPNTTRPVLWRHAHAMWLFPLPHVVVVADKVDGFICRYGGTLGLNPGSFGTDFSFQIYLPAERRAQRCSLGSEHVGVRDDVGRANSDVERVEEEVGKEGGKDTTDDPTKSDGQDHAEFGDSIDAAAGSSDMEMSAADSDTDTLPPPAQPRSPQIDGTNGTMQNAETLPPNSNDFISFGSDVENGRNYTSDGEDINEGELDSGNEVESDDESSLVAPEGIEKRDIKAILRLSADAAESNPINVESEEDR